MYTNTQKGYINRQQGENFETYIDSACEYYKVNGFGNIEKTPEPMKIIRVFDREKGLFVASFEKKAQADYKGVLPGGRCIHFEAKSTRTDRILNNAVSDKQRDNLSLTAELGGLCFILVSLITENKFYKVPWDIWLNMKEIFGHKYMDANDLHPYEIKMCIYGLDFLNKAYSR